MSGYDELVRRLQRILFCMANEEEDTLLAAIAAIGDLEAEVERLKGVILWADGQNGEWPERKPGEGAYYWRKELMRRAALEAKP